MTKILFFDDETFISSFIIRNLQDLYGWNSSQEGDIKYVSSVTDLLNEINSTTIYDLFILDIMTGMPHWQLFPEFTTDELQRMNNGMNFGIVMAYKIRNIEKYKSTPIIFLSARNIPNLDMEKIAYLRKPISANVLDEQMKEFTKQKKANQ